MEPLHKRGKDQPAHYGDPQKHRQRGDGGGHAQAVLFRDGHILDRIHQPLINIDQLLESAYTIRISWLGLARFYRKRQRYLFVANQGEDGLLDEVVVTPHCDHRLHCAALLIYQPTLTRLVK